MQTIKYNSIIFCRPESGEKKSAKNILFLGPAEVRRIIGAQMRVLRCNFALPFCPVLSNKPVDSCYSPVFCTHTQNWTKSLCFAASRVQYKSPSTRLIWSAGILFQQSKCIISRARQAAGILFYLAATGASVHCYNCTNCNWQSASDDKTKLARLIACTVSLLRLCRD